MTCEHHPYYNKHCVHCMVRRIKSLRGPDAKTSRRTQDMLFSYMPLEVASQVKDILRQERECS